MKKPWDIFQIVVAGLFILVTSLIAYGGLFFVTSLMSHLVTISNVPIVSGIAAFTFGLGVATAIHNVERKFVNENALNWIVALATTATWLFAIAILK